MAGTTAPSFAAAAAGATVDDAPLAGVRLDAHALLKIVAHVTERAPSLVTGQLLGLDVGSTLEVTEAFPFPVSGEGESWQGASMRRCEARWLAHVAAFAFAGGPVGARLSARRVFAGLVADDEGARVVFGGRKTSPIGGSPFPPLFPPFSRAATLATRATMRTASSTRST